MSKIVLTKYSTKHIKTALQGPAGASASLPLGWRYVGALPANWTIDSAYSMAVQDTDETCAYLVLTNTDDGFSDLLKYDFATGLFTVLYDFTVDLVWAYTIELSATELLIFSSTGRIYKYVKATGLMYIKSFPVTVDPARWRAIPFSSSEIYLLDSNDIELYNPTADVANTDVLTDTIVSYDNVSGALVLTTGTDWAVDDIVRNSATLEQGTIISRTDATHYVVSAGLGWIPTDTLEFYRRPSAFTAKITGAVVCNGGFAIKNGTKILLSRGGNTTSQIVREYDTVGNTIADVAWILPSRFQWGSWFSDSTYLYLSGNDISATAQFNYEFYKIKISDGTWQEKQHRPYNGTDNSSIAIQTSANSFLVLATSGVWEYRES